MWYTFPNFNLVPLFHHMMQIYIYQILAALELTISQIEIMEGVLSTVKIFYPESNLKLPSYLKVLECLDLKIKCTFLIINLTY